LLRFAKIAQKRETFRPSPKTASSVDVTDFTHRYELTTPRTREGLRARDRDKWVVGAGNHNTWKWKSQ